MKKRLPKHQPAAQANKSSSSIKSAFLALTQRQIVAIVLVLGVGNLGIIFLLLDKGGDGTAPYKKAGRVTIEYLPTPDSSFAAKCEQRGVPLVIRNSGVERWDARKKWTPSYLASKTSVLKGVYENDNRWFGPYYDDRKPMTPMFDRVNPYKIGLELPSAEFFRSIQSPSDGRYLYFTGDIEQLGDWAWNEIQPSKELLVLNPTHSSVNVWIGQPHVIAHCHYDGYHNFYAQLYGRKKFTLFSPAAWPGLSPYPFLHPSHAQCQVNVSNSARDVVRFPALKDVTPLEVILEPGDLLYLPPLWFHHVESMEVSISVNVWTDTKQTTTVERLFALPLVTSSIQFPSSRHRAIATSILIHKFVVSLCNLRSCVSPTQDSSSFPSSALNKEAKKMDTAAYFVYRLWRARYSLLMEEGKLPSSLEGGEPILCEAGEPAALLKMLMETLEVLSGQHVKEHGDSVATLLRQLPVDTWEIWAGNYVEYVAASAVDVRHVGLFLMHLTSCINTVFKP
eukprot:Em0019g914a